MQQIEQLPALEKTAQTQVDDVVENLAILGSHSENTAEIIHDARNMVTALDLYCDLLQEPGVLCDPFAHYGRELRLVAAASRRLVEKLTAAEMDETDAAFGPGAKNSAMRLRSSNARRQLWKDVPPRPVKNLAEEVLANRNLLCAIAGHAVSLTMDVQNGTVPVHLSGEDLTRILVNLVKNASEAMSGVGRIHVSLWEHSGESDASRWVTLNVEDNGPGLNEKTLGNLFRPQPQRTRSGEWPYVRHGLGLSVVRSLVQSAGGRIHAANRDPAGACFQIELPVQVS